MVIDFNRILILSIQASMLESILLEIESFGGRHLRKAHTLIQSKIVWGSTKQFFRSQYKPKIWMNQIKVCIKEFLSGLIPNICQNYTKHLHKVVPKVVEVSGNPSGY